MGCKRRAVRNVRLEGRGVLAVSQELNAFIVDALFTL